MKRITLIYIGQTGAGPVYSLEMAKALASASDCILQVIINENVTNLGIWNSTFKDTTVDFHIVNAYRHTKASVFFNYFNYAKKYNIVRIIKKFNPDVLYVPFGLMWARFIFFFLPQRIKVISTIHDVKPHDKFNFGEVASMLLNVGSGRFVDGYVILNQKDRQYVEENSHRPVAVIPHASYGYYFTSRNAEATLTKSIGFLGRIEPYKGLDLLVEAFEMIKTPDIKLLIAGSGTIDVELKNRIEKNEGITLINRYIKDEEFQPLLDRCDFVVLPYKRASQSGVIPLCFAYGKTVIATNVGALSEQVPEGTGIITEPKADEIARQIDLLYSNPELIIQYGKSAKLYAESELSWEHSARLLIDFVETLLKHNL